MPHFFVPPQNRKGLSFHFGPEESNHLVKVLRKKDGDVVEIFDGEGGVWSASLLDCSNPARVKGRVLENASPPQSKLTLPSISLEIYPALLKGERFDWMLEKLTEIGVSAIHPVVTERTLVILEPGRIATRTERWKKIALSAAKQCGRADLPQVFPPIPFQEARKPSASCDLDLFLWESEEKTSLSEALKKWEASRPSKNSYSVRLFAGPEGGYTMKEAGIAKQSGAAWVLLGENILRAETASIAAASRILL